MIERILVLSGVSIFGLLGFVHIALTFFSNKFMPNEVKTYNRMKSASPLISRDTTMWNAWIGFNASHSVGLIFIPAIYIPLINNNFEFLVIYPWYFMLPTFVGLVYLILAKKYWFKVPAFGMLIATLCFASATLKVYVIN